MNDRLFQWADFCYQRTGVHVNVLKDTHAKFGVNISDLHRETASDEVWHHAIKLIDAKYKNSFIYGHEIHNVLSAWSEDNLTRIWWKSDKISSEKYVFKENKNGGQEVWPTTAKFVSWSKESIYCKRQN